MKKWLRRRQQLNSGGAHCVWCKILLINIHEECKFQLLSSLELENKGKAPRLLDELAELGN